MKSVETGGWEPITECPPSEQFVCSYGGNFSQHLLINRGQIDRFLDIASLDGRVLLQESKVRRPQALPDGINPDGSVAGRGGLRWGQKLETEDKKQNPYFQVDSDPAGWVISVNGNLIAEDLMKKGNLSAREVEKRAANKINDYTRVGLREALLKDKFTPAKDPYIGGKITPTFFLSWIYLNSITSLNIANTIWALFFASSTLMAYKYEDPREYNMLSQIYNLRRKTLKVRVELIDTPLEIDRALFSYAYLDYQKYLGEPLIRVADV